MDERIQGSNPKWEANIHDRAYEALHTIHGYTADPEDLLEAYGHAIKAGKLYRRSGELQEANRLFRNAVELAKELGDEKKVIIAQKKIK